MKCFLKKYQSGLKAFGVLFLTLAVLFLIIYFIFFNKVHLNFVRPEEKADNDIRNTQTYNDFVTSAGGKLYLAYSGSNFKSGIYEIAFPFARCIDWEGITFFTGTECISYVYHDTLLLQNLVKNDDDDTQREVCTLQDSKPIVSVDKSKYDIYDYFTYDNELYFRSESGKTVYRYAEGKMETVVSEKLCGKGFRPLQYYKGDLYFVYGTEPILYRYDLKDKKIVGEIDLSGMEDLFRQYPHSHDFLVCDDCIYYEFSVGSFYRYDLTTKQAVKLEGLQSSTSFNAYGNNAYALFCGETGNEKNGLYVMTNDSDKIVRLKQGDFTGVAIIDNTWVYLKTTGGNVYRITKDGKDYQKVF